MITFFSNMMAATWALLTVYYIPVLIFYVVGGILYTILKWYFDIFKLRRSILNSVKIKEFQERGLDDNIEDEKLRLSRQLFDGYSYPPQFSDNLSTIVTRAIFWPLCLAWLLIGELAIDIWTAIYESTVSFFQRISDRMLP